MSQSTFQYFNIATLKVSPALPSEPATKAFNSSVNFSSPVKIQEPGTPTYTKPFQTVYDHGYSSENTAIDSLSIFSTRFPHNCTGEDLDFSFSNTLAPPSLLNGITISLLGMHTRASYT